MVPLHTDLPSLLPIDSLPKLPESAQTATVDTLFEPTSELHSIALPLIRCYPASYDDLIERIRSELLQLVRQGDASRATLEGILGAHPRLGEKKVESALSRMEQARMAAASVSTGTGVNAGVGSVDRNEGVKTQEEEEAELLRGLNDEYERKFPGLRYVVFVNGRPRSVIMENMKARILRGDVVKEREEGVNAMCDIAKDRCRKLGVA